MQEGDFWIWCLYFVLIVVLYETVRRLRRGYRHVDTIEFDERTNRITKQSLSVSWCLTFVTVGTLVSGVMIGSFLVAHCYYSRKGDV